jgi:hypothetical protein
MKTRLFPAAVLFVATSFGTMPAHAAEHIECVAERMTAEQRTRLEAMSRVDTPESMEGLSNSFVILGPTAQSCAATHGWNAGAMDDAMKFTLYQTIIRLAEAPDGIPLNVRQRADAFIAAQPAGTMDRLATGELAGEERRAWLGRLFEASYPDSEEALANPRVEDDFFWLSMYVLFRHMATRRAAIFQSR